MAFSFAQTIAAKAGNAEALAAASAAREGKAFQCERDDVSLQKPADRANLVAGVVWQGQYGGAYPTGRLGVSQDNFCGMAGRELKYIGETIALLLKGVVDEGAARHYPDRDRYIKLVMTALQSRAAYLAAYIAEREGTRWCEDERAAIAADGRG